MPGEASGPRGSEPTAQLGGLSFTLDGVPAGEARAEINLVSSIGVAPRVVDDATPGSEKADVGFDLSAMELLVPPVTGLDLVAGVGTLALIPALAGGRVVLPMRFVFVPELVDPAPAVQPIIQIETPPGGLNDVFVFSATLGCTDVDLHELNNGTPVIRHTLTSVPPANVLNLVQTGLATAANYRVTLLVYGYVLVP